MGKATPEFMRDAIYSGLGKKSSHLLIGPRRGSDNAAIGVGGGRVMILTVDPVSVIPRLGMRLSAWLSVHLIASDYVTSGLMPEYATFSFNFPPELGELDRRRYVRGVSEECRTLGVSIVAGHTGSYPGGGFTVVGAGSMFGFTRRGRFTDPSMARAGDVILMTKSAGIEATATLALSFPRFLRGKVGRRLWGKAAKVIRRCSVVEDARAAARAGLGRRGVTSMHDATEGGVLGGLAEMASASGTAFEVEVGRIPVTREVSATCSVFGLDPLRTLSEGALLATCNSSGARNLEAAVSAAGIEVSRIGAVKEGDGLWLAWPGGRLKRYRERRDPYWAAYMKGVERGLE